MKPIRRTHSAVVRLGFGMALLLFFLPFPTISQSLEWEVVNPFHFIRDLEAIDDLRAKHEELVKAGTASAHALEVALQRKDEAAVTARRQAAEARCKLIPEGTSDRERCEDRAKFPYLGWFARLGRNNHAGTCWDSSALEFRDDGSCKDYIESPRHRVRMWVVNPVSNDYSAWKWETGGAEPLQCSPKYERPICIEFEVETDNPVAVRAIAPDGSILEPKKILKVEDVLIAGLGDSFAAGEGNPDVPAQFLERESDTDYVWFWKFRRSARKDRVDQDIGGLADPAWLDKRCHRSMYSYQFKAALQYALENPTKSVTFASVSCSGAELPELIDTWQKPKEQMKGATVYRTEGDRKKIKPQIRALEELLQPRRSGIDYLLLSIGGNDAGFAKYVAYVMLSGKTLWLAKQAKQARKPDKKKVEDAITELQKQYGELNRQLRILPFKRINHETFPSKRIILTGYPDYLQDQKGNLCKVTRDEFSMPFNRDEGRTKRMKELATDVYPLLNGLQKDAKRIPWWTLALPDEVKWKEHGFCAQRTPLTVETVQERFIMPKRKNHRWYSIEPRCRTEVPKPPACDEKMDFDPRDYRTYGDRQRWVRLPVDSKLSVDQQSIVWLFSVDLLFTDDWSTVMHPTAEGLSVNADATLDAMHRLELSKPEVAGKPSAGLTPLDR